MARFTFSKRCDIGQIINIRSGYRRQGGQYRVLALVESGYDDGTRIWTYECSFVPPTHEQIESERNHQDLIRRMASEREGYDI